MQQKVKANRDYNKTIKLQLAFLPPTMFDGNSETAWLFVRFWAMNRA
jgi:hypothetical protein